jgi:hypothetical protein
LQEAKPADVLHGTYIFDGDDAGKARRGEALKQGLMPYVPILEQEGGGYSNVTGAIPSHHFTYKDGVRTEISEEEVHQIQTGPFARVLKNLNLAVLSETPAETVAKVLENMATPMSLVTIYPTESDEPKFGIASPAKEAKRGR